MAIDEGKLERDLNRELQKEFAAASRSRGSIAESETRSSAQRPQQPRRRTIADLAAERNSSEKARSAKELRVDWKALLTISFFVLVLPQLAPILASLIHPSVGAEREPLRSKPDTPNFGKWRITRDVDLMTDRHTVLLSLLAEDSDVSLHIYCAGSKSGVFIEWNRYLAPEGRDDGDRPVRVRFGSETSYEEDWYPSADDTATFAPFKERFVKSLRATDRFVAQATPYKDGAITVVFETAGLTEALASAVPECERYIFDLKRYDDVKEKLAPAKKGGAAGNGPLPEVRMWVLSDYVERRTCPSVACGTVGKLSRRETVVVSEKTKGWVRISKYYQAACVDGRSGFVEQGNALCTADNGIVDGRLAEWVNLDALTSVQPADLGKSATDVAALVKGSSDFHRFEEQFVAAATRLLQDGTCSEADLVNFGGFAKSSQPGSIYFTYCGGMNLQNRLYLDTSTGEVFR